MKKTLLLSLLLLLFCQHQAQVKMVLQTGHTSALKQIAFSYDDAHMASIGEENAILIWELKTGKQYATLPCSTGVNSICFHPSEAVLLSGGNDSTIVIWDYRSTGIMDTIRIRSGKISSIAFSADGTKLIVCAGAVICLDYKSKAILYTCPGIGYTNAALVGSQLLCQDDGPEYVLMNNPPGEKTDAIEGHELFAWNKGEEPALYTPGNWGNELLKYAVTNNGFKKAAKITENYERYRITALASSAKYVTVATRQRLIFVYTQKGLRKLYNLQGHQAIPGALCISNNEKWLASADESGAIFLWDLQSGMLTGVFQSNLSKIVDVALDADHTLIVLYRNGELKQFDLATNEVHTEKFDGYKFSANADYDFFAGRLLKVSDSIISFSMFRLKMNPDNEAERAEGYEVQFSRSKGDFSYSLTRKFNLAAGARKGSREDYGTSVVWTDLFDAAQLPLRQANGNGIIKQLQSESLGITINVYTQGFFEILSSKTGKTISCALVGDRGYLYSDSASSYFASKGALSAIAFRKDQKMYGFEQFDKLYNRPDIIFTELGYVSPAQVDAARAAYLKRTRLLHTDIAPDKLPVFELVLPKELVTEKANFNFKIRSADRFGTASVLHVIVNGVPWPDLSGIKINPGEKEDLEIQLQLEKGKNQVQVYLSDAGGNNSLTESFVVTSLLESGRKPDLYLVSIGASSYKEKEYNLAYAKKDAMDFADKMKRSRVFGKVHSLVLVDEAVTKSGVSGLKDFTKAAGEQDVFILFYAGHGILDKSLNYYLSTYAIQFDSPYEGIALDSLSQQIGFIKCRKKLMLIDACHSGEVDKEDLVVTSETKTSDGDLKFRAIGNNTVVSKNLYDSKSSIEISKMLFADTRSNNGVNIISSAGAAEYAIEGSEWKNGIFTYVFLNGIKTGAADLNKDGEIWVSEMQEYLNKKVSELSKGKQAPTSRSENLISNFRIW